MNLVDIALLLLLAAALFFAILAVVGLSAWGAVAGRDGITSMLLYVIAAVMFGGIALTTKGVTGIKRIMKNLKLTQSESMFRYVKRRQG